MAMYVFQRIPGEVHFLVIQVIHVGFLQSYYLVKTSAKMGGGTPPQSVVFCFFSSFCAAFFSRTKTPIPELGPSHE